MTLAEARDLVRMEPKRWRAAFVEAPGTPLLDHPEARVRLHPTVGAAYDELRSRKECLEAKGWTRTAGSLGGNILVYHREDEVCAIGLNKPRRRRRDQ